LLLAFSKDSFPSLNEKYAIPSEPMESKYPIPVKENPKLEIKRTIDK